LLTPFLIPQIVLTTRANKEQPADLELIAAVRCLVPPRMPPCASTASRRPPRVAPRHAPRPPRAAPPSPPPAPLPQAEELAAARSGALDDGRGASTQGVRRSLWRGTLLASVELSHNPLGEVGLRAIAEGVERCEGTLHRVSLRYVNHEPADADGRIEPVPLAPLLGPSGITHLDLSYNFVGTSNASSVDHLREALAANSTITSLSLRRCCIGGWRRARAIARGLARNTCLTSLDLGYNGLGAASQHPEAIASRDGVGGAGATVAAQATPATLRLSLAVDALCEALRENGTLTSLSLAHNALGDTAARALLYSAFLSKSMRRLDLRANGLTLDGLLGLTSFLITQQVCWLPAAPLADPDHYAPGAHGIADALCPAALQVGAWRFGARFSPLQFVDLRQNALHHMICQETPPASPDYSWSAMETNARGMAADLRTRPLADATAAYTEHVSALLAKGERVAALEHEVASRGAIASVAGAAAAAN